jgi:hypothetical protein
MLWRHEFVDRAASLFDHNYEGIEMDRGDVGLEWTRRTNEPPVVIVPILHNGAKFIEPVGELMDVGGKCIWTANNILTEVDAAWSRCGSNSSRLGICCSGR